MRRPLILAALAGIVGLFACSAETSAHGDRDQRYYGAYKERWYARYERRREAIERYRANAEARAYERRLAYQRNLTRSYWDDDEGYCCSRYGSYGYGPRVYGYSYNPYYYNLYNYRSLDRNYDFYEPRDRHWYPDDYLTGDKTWWKRIDREGRGGRN